MLQLMNREWRTFNIGALFQVKRPKTRVESQYLAGNSPFVASGAVNNGVTGFYQATSEEQLDKGNCITVSPVDGTAFWQSSDFLGRGGAGSAILLLYNNFLNKYSGMFMTRMIQKTCSKYSYGNMGNQKNIVREVVMLPVDNAGKPDYAFMEEYIKEREQQLIQKYIAHVRNTSVIIGGGITPLHEKDWRCFVLGDLFTLIPGKGKGANHLKTAKQACPVLTRPSAPADRPVEYCGIHSSAHADIRLPYGHPAASHCHRKASPQHHSNGTAAPSRSPNPQS